MVAGGASAQSKGVSTQTTASSQQQMVLRQTNRKVVLYRNAARHWQSLMGHHHTQSSYAANHIKSVNYASWVLKLWKQRAQRLHAQARHWMVRRTKSYRAGIALMRGTMGISPGPARQLASSGSIEARYNQMRKLNRVTLSRWRHPPHESQLMCIHGYEGSWNDTRNPKYKGGLQTDIYFEATYGPNLVRKYGGYIAVDSAGHHYAVGGHSDLWTPLEQMWAAENAIRSRGFSPWPYTAHECKLI